MNNINVSVINLENKRIINCQLEYISKSPYTIILSCFQEKFQVNGEDLFEATLKIRKKLNDKQMDLLINASRINIFPSPLLRANSGNKAYYLRFRVQARLQDIVNIFEPIKKLELATIADQKEFHSQWLSSLSPTEAEIKEATKQPNGWIYRIDENINPDGAIPPNAIIGAWKVDNMGHLTNEWKENKSYVPI